MPSASQSALMVTGEVTLAGKKVVGVSQRRGRSGALFQCACLLEWQPERLVGLLDLSPAERLSVTSDVADLAVGLGPSLSPSEVVHGLIDALPA